MRDAEIVGELPLSESSLLSHGLESSCANLNLHWLVPTHNLHDGGNRLTFGDLPLQIFLRKALRFDKEH